jgi:cardiolipin synthase
MITFASTDDADASYLVTLIAVAGYLVTLLLIRWVLLTKIRNPVSAVAWIMAIILLPYFGGLLFLVFGINRVERQAAGKIAARIAVGRFLPELSQYQIIPSEVPDAEQEQFMRLTSAFARTVPTFGNKIELLSDTNRALGLITQAVQSARETLHLEYYIWRSDRTGTRLRDLLIKKAREGVKVRFLYDVIGSILLTRRFLRPMREAGIQVAAFLPGRSWRGRWSLNLRSHRKIVVVDGQIGFTGGMNIGDEYLGLNPHLGYWRDTHLKLVGPAVLQLQQVFAADWYHATQEELTQPEIFPRPRESGTVSAMVVAGEPVGNVRAFHSIMFAAINAASDRITLATSYFVPTGPLLAALETVAQRGVRVRLLLAGKSAYRWTVFAGRSYYDTLLLAGVEIYEYEHGLLHTKTLSIDGHWSLVGTPNFDTRSLLLNFEVGAVTFDKKIAAQLESHFEEDLKHARKIDREAWAARPTRHVLVENVCRLFAPVL